MSEQSPVLDDVARLDGLLVELEEQVLAPESGRGPLLSGVPLFATIAIVFGPIAGVIIASVALLGKGVTLLDLLLAVVFYALAGHGLTAGYHRMFTHRSFQAKRWVKIALALCGSLGFEGGPIAWPANHRRHHAFTDNVGDPHSPYLSSPGPYAELRGALHAHLGWLFRQQPTDVEAWVPDLLRDRDLVFIDRLFPLMCLLSLGLPALLGFAFTGTAAGAFGGFIFGGLVRVFVLQHATFAVNSACHLWGNRPFSTPNGDRSTNFAPLAVLSMGENWHNLHHSCPTLARHGVDRRQIDSTARLIAILESFGLVSKVRWPNRAGLDARRLAPERASRRRDKPVERTTEHQLDRGRVL